jgi:hypothetical protein
MKMPTYRPRHFNSTGGVSGGVLTVGAFSAIRWIWPETTPAPPEVVAAVTVAATWLASQFGRIDVRGTGKG